MVRIAGAGYVKCCVAIRANASKASGCPEGEDIFKLRVPKSGLNSAEVEHDSISQLRMGKEG